MAIDKTLLIEWIHTLDNGKRLDGFVTEVFFEKYLAPERANLVSPAFGWFTASLPKEEEKYQYWIKVVPRGYVPNSTEITLIETYARRGGNKFFFLHAVTTSDVLTQEKLPISFEVTQWAYSESRGRACAREGNDADTTARKNLEAAISQMDVRLTGHLKNQETVSQKSHELRIAKWLDGAFTRDELFSLFVTRCAINLIFKNAVDRDAIDMSDGRLRFIEFKRKYPSNNGWWELISEPSFISHNKEADRLENLRKDEFYKTSNNERRKQIAVEWEAQIREDLSDKSRWRQVKKSCFGLDLSHVQKVLQAETDGCDYVHIIWDQRETELVRLLEFDLSPKNVVVLKTFMLTRQSFQGVTVTPGRKASSFYIHPRMQLTFPADGHT